MTDFNKIFSTCDFVEDTHARKCSNKFGTSLAQPYLWHTPENEVVEFKDGAWKHFRFKGSMWQNINKEADRRYQINAYRVILTRARRGMVIYIPQGSDDDHTRNRKYYDGTYEYLKELGIQEI